MKVPHLLRVEAPPSAFAPVIAALREAGFGVGWLEWGAVAPQATSAAGLRSEPAGSARGRGGSSEAAASRSPAPPFEPEAARPAQAPALDAGAAGPPLRSLEEAASLGVRRAVVVEAGRTLALKPRHGEPVLRDLLREHFLGCRLVLVAGAPRAAAALSRANPPLLESDGDGWRVTAGTATWRRLTTDQLVAALCKPHPFSP